MLSKIRQNTLWEMLQQVEIVCLILNVLAGEVNYTAVISATINQMSP